MFASFLPSKGQIQVALLRLFGRLPLSLGRRIGAFFGGLLSYTNNYNTRITRENIAHCFPQLSQSEQKQLVRKSLAHTGMLSIEMSMVWCKSATWLEKQIITVKGFERYEDALNQGQGVILLAPHLGNWEVIGQYVAPRHSLMNMYTPPKSLEMDALVAQSRTKTGGLVAPANSRGLAMLLKHLKAGHTVGILPDQVPDDKNRSSLIAPFFNQPAHTMTLVTQMIRKTQCRAIAVVAVRVKGGFELQFTEVDNDLYSEDDVNSVTALNRTVQHLVENIPEQYQWEYKRFKGIKKLTTL